MELGPLEVFFCWQSAVMAVSINGVTEGVKRIIDFYVGKELRKQKRFLTKLVLPSVPLVLGVIFGITFPLLPDVLMEYLQTHGYKRYLIGAFYGLAVGQLSDYLYNRLTDLIRKPQAPAAPESVPPESMPPAEGEK